MTIPRSMLVCLAAAFLAAADDRPTTRVYTNDDLDRVRDRRGETGVTSNVANAPRGPSQRAVKPGRQQDERYWRQEAEREQRKLKPSRRRLADLEQKLAERRAAPTPRSGVRPPTDALEARIQALRKRLQEQQERFQDRARREGALPGWLR